MSDDPFNERFTDSEDSDQPIKFEPLEIPSVKPPPPLHKPKAPRVDMAYLEEDPMRVRKQMFKLQRKLKILRAEHEEEVEAQQRRDEAK